MQTYDELDNPVRGRNPNPRLGKAAEFLHQPAHLPGEVFVRHIGVMTGGEPFPTLHVDNHFRECFRLLLVELYGDLLPHHDQARVGSHAIGKRFKAARVDAGKGDFTSSPVCGAAILQTVSIFGLMVTVIDFSA